MKPDDDDLQEKWIVIFQREVCESSKMKRLLFLRAAA